MNSTPSPLREIRRLKNLTLEEVGQAVELSAAQLSRIERDGCKVRDTADRIASHFRNELTIEQIMFPARRARRARK